MGRRWRWPSTRERFVSVSRGIRCASGRLVGRPPARCLPRRAIGDKTHVTWHFPGSAEPPLGEIHGRDTLHLNFSCLGEHCLTRTRFTSRQPALMQRGQGELGIDPSSHIFLPLVSHSGSRRAVSYQTCFCSSLPATNKHKQQPSSSLWSLDYTTSDEGTQYVFTCSETGPNHPCGLHCVIGNFISSLHLFPLSSAGVDCS